MLEYLALTGKFLSESPFIISLLILGYLGCNRDKFARISVAVFFSVILTCYLKAVFKYPLPPGMHAGWGFPSGHQSTSIVLWLAMAWEFRSKAVLALGIIANGFVAYAMLYYNFHFEKDLFAALGQSLTLLAIYYYTLKVWPRKKEFEAFFLFGVVGMLLNFYNETPEEWMYHSWRANAAIFGYGLGWGIVYSNKLNFNKSKMFKIFRSLIGLGGFVGIYYIFDNIHVNTKDSTTAFFQFFLMSLWVSLFTEQLCRPLNKIFFDDRKKNR
ncbi:MAG: hypothetical protein RLN62_05715 [Rickettsiales bacterium]